MSQRLLLRLGTTCNNGCTHCTVEDIRGTTEDRSTVEIFERLAEGRQRGATEVVFMRGEPTIRPDFLRLVRRARDLGYGWVQVQSNGRMFSALPFVRESMNAGMKAAEVSLYGPTAEIHDSIARVGGAFEQTASGIQKLAMEGALQHVNIPVTRKNVHCLTEILEVLESWFVERAQIVMTRPVGEEWPTQSGEAVPVEEAIPHVLKALNEAEGWDIDVRTEGIPLCVLDEFPSAASDRFPPKQSIWIDDVHRSTGDLDTLRSRYRPFPEGCMTCMEQPHCPGTWKGLWGPHPETWIRPREELSPR